MVNKPKAIGTAAETAVRKYLLTRGFSEHQAHRNVLAGAADEGDVWLRHPRHGLIVFEVKGGNAAKTASHNQVRAWHEEAQNESDNAGGNFSVLVTQRAGFGAPRAGEWWAYVDDFEFSGLTGGHLDRNILLRMTLSEYMDVLDAAQSPRV